MPSASFSSDLVARLKAKTSTLVLPACSPTVKMSVPLFSPNHRSLVVVVLVALICGNSICSSIVASQVP